MHHLVRDGHAFFLVALAAAFRLPAGLRRGADEGHRVCEVGEKSFNGVLIATRDFDPVCLAPIRAGIGRPAVRAVERAERRLSRLSAV